MWIKGRLQKEEKFWLVEIPAVDYMTQGRTRKEAYEMAKDLLESLADSAGYRLNVTIVPCEANEFYAGADDSKTFTAFVLRYWRLAHGMTLRQAADRLGAKSATAYARYEQGKSEPTVSMMERLISAVGENDPLTVIFGPTPSPRKIHRREKIALRV
jgi:predicted RNase H-like HicB family nuclease